MKNQTHNISGYFTPNLTLNYIAPYNITLKDIQPHPISTEKPDYIATLEIITLDDNVHDESIPEPEPNPIPEQYGAETNTRENHYISPFDEGLIHEFQENYHTVITGKIIEWYGQKQPSNYDYQYRVESLAHHTPKMQEDSNYIILGHKDNFIPVTADVVLFGLDKDDDGFLYIVKTVIRT